MRWIPKNIIKVKRLDAGFDQILKADDLVTQLPRAIVWAMASAGLTPAGRITEMLEDGNALRVSIGRNDGIGDDSLLRIFRPRGRSKTAEEPSDTPLPITLKVRWLDDHSCLVIPVRLGLDGYWEEDGLSPRVGDIVYNPYEPKRKIAVFPPEDKSKDIAFGDARTMSGRSDVAAQRIITDQFSLAKSVQSKLRNGFLKLDAAYDSEGIQIKQRDNTFKLDVVATCTAAAKNGATHALGGYIKPNRSTRPGAHKYDVELILYELKQDADGQWRLGRTSLALPTIILGTRSWD